MPKSLRTATDNLANDLIEARKNAVRFATSVAIDPDALLEAYRKLEVRIPGTRYNKIKDGNRIGWALISCTGKVSDIHGRRFRPYDSETQFDKPTRALRGYLADVLEDMVTLIGPIYRARIITIDGYREIAPHHDGHDGSRFYRYHIPIVPNPQCIFWSEGQPFVMPQAGRLYRFPAWLTHAVINPSGLRSHLMFSSYEDVKVDRSS